VAKAWTRPRQRSGPAGAHPAPVTVEELAPRITFTRRKFRDFDVRETQHSIEVDVKAPIIDDG
jgi:hypothetical protein